MGLFGKSLLPAVTLSELSWSIGTIMTTNAGGLQISLYACVGNLEEIPGVTCTEVSWQMAFRSGDWHARSVLGHDVPGKPGSALNWNSSLCQGQPDAGVLTAFHIRGCLFHDHATQHY